MVINGIYVLGDLIPIAGEEYGVARITSVDGSIPEGIMAMTHRMSDDVKARRITKAPSEYGFENSPMEDLAAVYVMVSQSGAAGEDGSVNLKIIESMDEFLAPFDFPDDVKKEYIDYFIKKRTGAAGLDHITFELDDSDTGNTSTSMAWVNSYEKYYLSVQANQFAENNAVLEPQQILNPEQFSQLRSDLVIQLMLTEMLDKGVNFYNGLNYMNKADDIAKSIASTHISADDIAKTIAGCSYISESGVKSPLNFTAIEKMFSNVKDRLLVGGVATGSSEDNAESPLNFTAIEKMFSDVKDKLLVGSAVAKPVVRRNE